MKNRRSLRLIVALLAVFGLMAAACGGSDSDGDNSTAEPADEATETTAAPATTEAMDDMDEDAPDETAAPTTTAAPAGPANALAEAVTIRQTCAPAIASLPFWVARDEGMLADRNLTVECVQIGSGPETAAALVAGEAEMAGNIYNNVIPLVDGGLDVVAWRQSLDAQLFDIVVSNSVELPEGGTWQEVMAALDGLNVGVVARGAAAEDVARILLEGAGLDPENTTYIAVGLDSVSPMVGGEIDWTITFDPLITLAVLNGVGNRPFSLQQDEGPEGLNWPGLAQTTSRSYAESSPEVLCAYGSAMDDAVAYINDPANFDRVVEIAVAGTGNDNVELIETLVTNYGPLFSADGAIDTGAIDSIGTLVQSLGKSEGLIQSGDFVLEPSCG